MTVFRYVLDWSIPNAGPAVSVLHFRGDAGAGPLDDSVGELHTALTAVRDLFPPVVSIGFPAEALVIDVASGQLVGTADLTIRQRVVGTGTGTYAAAAGARVKWHTGVVRRGRRVVGSTFLVPLSANEYNNNGRLGVAAHSELGSAMAGFRTNAAGRAPLVVYSRPLPGEAGAANEVVWSEVSETLATLRGRKQ